MSSLDFLVALEGHADRVWHVSWHPTRDLLATCSGDKTVRVWAPRSAPPPSSSSSSSSSGSARASSARGGPWACLAVLDDFTQRTVRNCEWSPCGRFLAAGSFDGNAYVWRVGGAGVEGGSSHDDDDAAVPLTSSTVTFRSVATLEGHENEVKCVAWSPSGSLLATCSRDKSVWLWEVVDDGEDFDCMAVLHGHEQDVKFIRWHPTRELLLSASYDNTVRVWGEAEDDWVCIDTLSAHASTVWQVALDGEGKRLASVGDDGSLIVWEATQSAPGSSPVVDALTFGKVLAVPEAHSRTIFGCDWSRRPRRRAREGEGEGAGAGEGEGDMYPPRIATCGADDAIRVWREEGTEEGGKGELTLPRVVTLEGAHFGDVNSVRWHPRDTTLLASAGDDGLVKLWRYREV
jgi:cytosolic iron-sulfur protein assembly protein CIAO1